MKKEANEEEVTLARRQAYISKNSKQFGVAGH
jgi:hypothetical protein